MNEELFLNQRKPDWLRLMELCDRADRSPSDLDRTQLLEMFRLYRRISTDLATARTISTSPSLINYLNALTVRAYAVVYRQPRQSLKKVFVDSVVLSVQTVRRRRWFIYTAIGLFFGSAVVTFFLSLLSPTMHDYLAPKQMAEVFAQWKMGVLPSRTGSTDAMMWGFYASNNPRVAIITGAVGTASFGFLSVIMAFQNGAEMGSLASEMFSVHKLGFLIASIAPHGVPEISGLIFSTACGLLLGWALIHPGELTRGESLKSVGKDAITLLATSIVMMFIAAPIEGFFSFNPVIPIWLKVIVAIINFSLWIAFWNFFAKDKNAIPS